MTLLELTVVILVLLSLISILFIGARAWKKGSDRSGCVLNIRNAQQAVRSYQNLYQVPEGTTINMLTDLIGPGKFIASEPICPGGGDYDLIASIPPPGVLALTCSLVNSDDHAPASSGGW
jgi:type II secretory pathway pseudopilin PulG